MTLLQNKMFLWFALYLASSRVIMVLFSLSHCHAFVICNFCFYSFGYCGSTAWSRPPATGPFCLILIRKVAFNNNSDYSIKKSCSLIGYRISSPDFSINRRVSHVMHLQLDRSMHHAWVNEQYASSSGCLMRLNGFSFSPMKMPTKMKLWDFMSCQWAV